MDENNEFEEYGEELFICKYCGYQELITLTSENIDVNHTCSYCCNKSTNI